MSDQSDLFGEKELEYAQAQFNELDAVIPRKERELDSLRRKRNAYREIIEASEPLTPVVKKEPGKEPAKPEPVLTVRQALDSPTFFAKSAEDVNFDRERFNWLARRCVQEADKINLHGIRSFVADKDAKLAAFPKLLDRCSSYLFVLNKRGEIKPLDVNHRPWTFVKTENFRALQPAAQESAGNEASATPEGGE